MRVANKLTPELKSKMAEIMPEHTGRAVRPEGTRRGFQSSTMKCSGACRRGYHEVLGGLSKRVVGKPKMFLHLGKGPDAGHISS